MVSKTRKYKKVAVLKGGPSSEREISLKSGAAVAKGLKAAGYDVIEIDVRERKLDIPDGVEAVFIALHGEFGEDGQVQRILETRGVPYNGSDSVASERAFDKAAAVLGLPYPGGVAIDRVSEGRNPAAVKFPRSMIHDPSSNMSFSGLKTALRTHLANRAAPPSPDEVADIAASFQEAVVDVLVHKAVAAARAQGVVDVVVAGGVAANRRLRAKMADACVAAGLRAHLVPLALCTDNAAMVAGVGHHYLFGELAGAPAPRGLDMDPWVRHVADGW